MLALETARRAPYEEYATPEAVPHFDLVPVFGPDRGRLEDFRGVRRADSGRVVSVVSSRYGLLPHAEVAGAVHAIAGALDAPAQDPGAPAFPRERITLFRGGRAMELRLVVGTRYELPGGDAVYPAVRVVNSVDSKLALACEGLGVRLACANQLVAGMDAIVAFREVHLAAKEDLLGLLQKAIHTILSKFKDATRRYEAAMGEELLAEEVEPRLVAAGLPRVHASAIGARAEAEASHNGLTTAWRAYNCATDAITHRIGPGVSPARAREFERAAAGALLAPA